jgi:hypothetical protein
LEKNLERVTNGSVFGGEFTSENDDPIKKAANKTSADN